MTLAQNEHDNYGGRRVWNSATKPFQAHLSTQIYIALPIYSISFKPFHFNVLRYYLNEIVIFS